MSMTAGASNLDETPFFFSHPGGRLFGIYHAPGAERVVGAWVFCHPFAEEKLWAQRVYVSFARELARHGYAVLRFDMSGHGDSDGRFEDASIEKYVADTRAALTELSGRVPAGCPLGLFGLRLGASIAVLAAENDDRVKRLVLWEPILDGEKYGQEILMTNLATQMATHGKVITERTKLVAQMEAGQTVNVDGYEVAGPMFRQICGINLAGRGATFGDPCLIVQVDRGPKPPRKDFQGLTGRFPAAEFAQVVEQPFWKEIKEFYGKADKLFAVTLPWIERHS